MADSGGTEILGKLIYEEDTQNHLDDIFGRRKGKYRKPGKKITIFTTIVFIMAIITYLILFVIISPNFKDIDYFVFIVGVFGLTIGLMLLIRAYLIIDNLKIYSNGIALPKRTMIEYFQKKEHFILFKDILEIKKPYIRNDRYQKPIKIIKNNGSVEKIFPYYFYNLEKIEKLIQDKVKITNNNK